MATSADRSATSQTSLNPAVIVTDWPFILAIWLASRLLIAAVILAVSPHMTPGPAVAPGSGRGLPAFANWDGAWYLRIASIGYDYAPDGRLHSVAFFPLYPALIRLFEFFGLSPVLSGVFVANAAFLVALVLIYNWTAEKLGVPAARWAVVVLASFPYSLFSGVVYTESLFLALSTAAMFSFDRGRYASASLLGALASATRVEGIMLLPAMIYAWARERRGLSALIASLSCLVGLAAYILYQYVVFHDPLAFVRVQSGWTTFRTVEPDWLDMISHPTPHNLVKDVMLVGSAALLIKTRDVLPPVALGFGAGALCLILASSNTISPDRHLYAISVFGMALGRLLSRHRAWGYAAIALFVAWLAFDAAKFALGQWVA